MPSIALPVATTNAAPQNPAFVNMISLLLTAPKQATPQPADPEETFVVTATPAQIADSMIKSMLGGLSAGSTHPMLAASAAAASAASAAAPATQNATGTPAAPLAPIANSVIQTMLGGPASGPASATSAAPVLPTADARKQRTVADLPALTAMVAPPAAPAMSTISTAPPSTAAQASRSAGAASSTVTSAPPLPAPAPPVMPLAKSEIAFTAILTPMKTSGTPASMADEAPQIVASSATTSNAPSMSSTTAIATAVAASSAPQPQSASSLQTQAAVPAAGKDSSEPQAGGNMQQGDNSSSQDDSAGSAAKAVISADAKVKPASVKQDDDEIAGAAQDRGPVAGATLTSFPEQARAAAAGAGANAPTIAPAPFHSTAEALRASEPALPEAPQLRAGAAQEISIRIAQPDASTIDLRVVERSGQLHVDVRTSDAAMQTSLRQDLGTLTNSLDRAGYHSETFTPSSTLERAASSSQAGTQDDRQDSSQNRGGSGEFSGGRRQQQQQKRASNWLEELEDQQ
jgi:hypothetical protein